MVLFERGAYYGLNSLLAIYLTGSVADRAKGIGFGGLGFSEDMVGLLLGVVYAITYVVPILGGALADRYGYRKMLLVAFALLSAGYFMSSQVTAYGVIFFTLVVMAMGSGLFKPIISGTIARTTNEGNSGMGFGIYYWMINLGALIAPIVAGLVRWNFDWRMVFIFSSIYCAFMFFPTIFLYKDPPKPKSTKSFKEVMSGALMVLSDARFMLLIFVYSCFWILYFQNFGSVLWFLRDFIDRTPVNEAFASVGIPFSFDVEHVTVINAGTIILLQVIVSRIVKSFKPLPTMVGGITIGVLGFVFLAFASTPWIFILGIAVFSIGEMTAHPKYYSYIGLVAPQDKKALYMGYAFLYGVIGSLIGSNLGGVMYETILKPLAGRTDVADQIRNFWLTFAAMGMVAMVGLVLYNRFFSEDTAQTRRRARAIMSGVYSVLLLAGAWFFGGSLFAGDTVVYKTMIQALIMLLIGAGGLAISLRRREE
ncbi:MAG: MFS transporter [Bacteroidetes bacterium]|nr:MFS transporter [Bacteroidota bacterium]